MTMERLSDSMCALIALAVIGQETKGITGPLDDSPTEHCAVLNFPGLMCKDWRSADELGEALRPRIKAKVREMMLGHEAQGLRFQNLQGPIKRALETAQIRVRDDEWNCSAVLKFQSGDVTLEIHYSYCDGIQQPAHCIPEAIEQY